MSSPATDLARLQDLLADRAGGELLRGDEALEVEALLALHPEVDLDSFDRAAAAIQLSLLPAPMEALPAHLRARILAEAPAHLAPLAPTPAAGPRATRPPLATAWLGWAVAAAAVVLLVARDLGAPPEAGPGYDELRGAGGSLATAWSTTEDPGGAGVTGEVVWNDELQAGFMRFEGLPANDPDEAQYQLWIFDTERPSEYPVDGGVFDSQGGELLVPIVAKLTVAEPTLFAITLERPGGVVVSTRERLLLTATPQ